MHGDAVIKQIQVWRIGNRRPCVIQTKGGIKVIGHEKPFRAVLGDKRGIFLHAVRDIDKADEDIEIQHVIFIQIGTGEVLQPVNPVGFEVACFHSL